VQQTACRPSGHPYTADPWPGDASTWGEITLSVLEEGAGGDVVLLLHGFPELSHSWRHQLPALADAGSRAVAPDLRGYGEADAYMSVALLERSIQKVTGPLVVERLPGVSHWVQQEVPERVNELLVAALGRARG